MASNPYVNKVELADGTVLIDLRNDNVTADKILAGYMAHDMSGAGITGTIQSQAGSTVTPTRSTQVFLVSGKYMTGNFTVNPIPNTYYTMEEAMALMFPVGSIYISTSSTAPSFGGTWREVVLKQTLAQEKTGSVDFYAGQGTGNVHYWQRIE